MVDVAKIGQLMELMERHGVDELVWEGVEVTEAKEGWTATNPGTIRLKKSRHGQAALPASAEKALAAHLAPLPDAPWDAVPQETVDAWAEGGKTT